MQELLIKYRFQGFPYIVADGKGEFYQLAHSTGKYTRKHRKLNRILNNGITEGYRIDRKFVSIYQLREVVYVSNEVIDPDNAELPF